jgi:DNA primase small subunit
LSKREWSFTIEDDIYIRYQSFNDIKEIQAAIRKKMPHKIDIGAVFTHPPKEHNSIASEQFRPTERELVFDIDMTDYDDIRTCCTGADICYRCWPFMTMAIRVIDRALRDDFAFRHILWVYSGRRGIHCWVCDPAARSLPNDARSAVVDYLSVHTSSENSEKKPKVSFDHFHPSLQRAYYLLEPYFKKYIADEVGQGLLSKKDQYVKVLNTLPEESVRKELHDLWEKNSKASGASRWMDVIEATTPPSNPSIARKRRVDYSLLGKWRYELVFKYCYPRLDANVSKTQNHLLKSPFCIHPKTGRVCIPIDSNSPDEFDPFAVPTLRTLCNQVIFADFSLFLVTFCVFYSLMTAKGKIVKVPQMKS